MPSVASRYIAEVVRRVVAPSARVESLKADLEGHFEEATANAEEADAVIRRLGTPEEVAASFMADVEMTYAGFWTRLTAFIGDIGICCLPLIPIGTICALAAPVIESGGPSTSPTSIALIALFALLAIGAVGVFLLYFPLLEQHYGRTFGKHAMKVRVVTEEGAPISLSAAFIRRLSYFFELIWLDALFVPFNEKKQRAFDMVAKTVVVHEPDTRSGAGGVLLCLAPWLVLAVSALLMAMLFAAP